MHEPLIKDILPMSAPDIGEGNERRHRTNLQFEASQAAIEFAIGRFDELFPELAGATIVMRSYFDVEVGCDNITTHSYPLLIPDIWWSTVLGRGEPQRLLVYCCFIGDASPSFYRVRTLNELSYAVSASDLLQRPELPDGAYDTLLKHVGPAVLLSAADMVKYMWELAKQLPMPPLTYARENLSDVRSYSCYTSEDSLNLSECTSLVSLIDKGDGAYIRFPPSIDLRHITLKLKPIIAPNNHFRRSILKLLPTVPEHYVVVDPAAIDGNTVTIKSNIAYHASFEYSLGVLMNTTTGSKAK